MQRVSVRRELARARAYGQSRDDVGRSLAVGPAIFKFIRNAWEGPPRRGKDASIDSDSTTCDPSGPHLTHLASPLRVLNSLPSARLPNDESSCFPSSAEFSRSAARECLASLRGDIKIVCAPCAYRSKFGILERSSLKSDPICRESEPNISCVGVRMEKINQSREVIKLLIFRKGPTLECRVTNFWNKLSQSFK